MPLISSPDGPVLEIIKGNDFLGELCHNLISNCPEYDTSTQYLPLFIQEFSQTTKWEVQMLLLFQASSRE